MSLAATWVDREIIILSEVSQRKINIIHYHLYMESKKKNDTMSLFTRQIDSQRQKNLWLPKERGTGEG